MTAPKRLTFEITADDIAIGQPRKCSYCPAALAIRRIGAGRHCTIQVHTDRIDLWRNFASSRFPPVLVARYGVTKKLADFIRKFDAGERVNPGRYTVPFVQGFDV
ncbi:MAG: hypothetical protein LC772_06800 [Chloroflexi bacterium]|nr:hypothetical protein [Chloroflexota bacterium]